MLLQDLKVVPIQTVPQKNIELRMLLKEMPMLIKRPGLLLQKVKMVNTLLLEDCLEMAMKTGRCEISMSSKELLMRMVFI